MEDRYGTSTDSLAQSINEYVFENGRRYHTYFGMDKYVIPTDEVSPPSSPVLKGLLTPPVEGTRQVSQFRSHLTSLSAILIPSQIGPEPRSYAASTRR
jgi:hypothetical protein